ncbi:hypothetical protein ESCO_003649 [Escovopsis weberi]|uniref:Uncharacterized protein n=1 Tax=Escovopsis weberi TaxID=150374 RepID=A0A0M9VX06_ESCWE|nr:hypothetical protein ESCO_003649 [Escovopsis weberi]
MEHVDWNPWKLPAPFVAPTLMTCLFLLVLSLLSPLYLWYGVLGNAGIGLYAGNVSGILAMFSLFCLASSWRKNNFAYDGDLALFAVVAMVGLSSLLLLNVAALATGGLQCRRAGLETQDKPFCFLFQRPRSADYNNGYYDTGG